MKMLLPKIDPDERWIEYVKPNGETMRMPVVTAKPCDKRHPERSWCVRYCGKVHRHGGHQGTRDVWCESPGAVEKRQYYLRLPGQTGPYLPFGWFEKIDGPAPPAE